MALKKITAIVRDDVQELLIKELHKYGVPGASVTPVKGYGEYINTYTDDCLDSCIKVEVFADESAANKIAAIIMQVTGSDTEGDGIVAISPVDCLFRVRDRKQFS